jgi:hypothetical protein
VRAAHREPDLKATLPERKRKRRTRRRRNWKKEEKLYGEGLEENATEEEGISNRQVSSTIIPPLTGYASTTDLLPGWTLTYNEQALARKIHIRSLKPRFRNFLSRWTKISELTQNRWAQSPARGTKRQILSRPGRSAASIRH